MGKDPVARCPVACDGVIPIVYPNQPITIPVAAVRGVMSMTQRAAIDEEESMRRTFTQPNSSPPLSIVGADSTQVRVLGLGHAGVAFYSGKTGEVAYYEYGRYNGDYGAVRSKAMPRLTFDKSGNPTNASFAGLLRALTQTNGGPYAFESVFVKLPNGTFDTLKLAAETQQRLVAARLAPAYDVKGNHCFTFSLKISEAGGVNANVAAAPDLDMILVSILGTGIKAPKDAAIELPARQMRVLQSRYRPLNVSKDGAILGSFAFPAGPYVK